MRDGVGVSSRESRESELDDRLSMKDLRKEKYSTELRCSSGAGEGGVI